MRHLTHLEGITTERIWERGVQIHWLKKLTSSTSELVYRNLRSINWRVVLRNLMSPKAPFYQEKIACDICLCFVLRTWHGLSRGGITVGCMLGEYILLKYIQSVTGCLHSRSMPVLCWSNKFVYFHFWANGMNVPVLTLSHQLVKYHLVLKPSPSPLYYFGSVAQKARKRKQDINSKVKYLIENKCV